MKVTVKFDESAALKPSEVKVIQAQSEETRQRNRQWMEMEALNDPIVVSVGVRPFARRLKKQLPIGVNLGELLELRLAELL